MTNTTQFSWRKVEAKDFKTYMENLRLKEEVQKTATEIRRNKEMTEEQRIAALQMLRTDAEEIAVETLGDRNFNAYKRSASWLRSVTTKNRRDCCAVVFHSSRGGFVEASTHVQTVRLV